MSDEICAFCLGGATEIPPFGTVKDAQDLLHPCSTCKLVTHRKCLVDWFNAIPLSQVQREYRDNTDAPPASDQAAQDPADVQAENQDDDADNEPNIINASFRTRWFSNVTLYYDEEPRPSFEPLTDAASVQLSTSCPQCKSTITFLMKQLVVLALNNIVKQSVSNMVLYAGVFLGISGAATGIVTMGYVGLARCGISMMDTLAPTSVLLSLLSKGSRKSTSGNWPLPFNSQSGSEKTLQMMDQLKFQHIPLLPVMLYRMRGVLPLECLFDSTSMFPWPKRLSELLICNYISSLGDHAFVKQLYANSKALAIRALLGRATMRTLNPGLLFRNINWWDPSIMIGAMIPVRWLYDLLYRFTFNKSHFDLARSIRPRDITANLSFEDVTTLENLELKLAGLQFDLHLKVKAATKSASAYKLVHYLGCASKLLRLLRDDIFISYVKTKLLYWYYKYKACCGHDYSSSLLTKLAMMTGVTSLLWPFVASDLGKLIFSLGLLRVTAFARVDKDKLIFLSNLIGLVGVAVAKDVFNLYLSRQRANQLSNLTVVQELRPRTESPSEQPPPNIPGAYRIQSL